MATAPPTKQEQACIDSLKKEVTPSMLDAEDSDFLDGNTYLRFARARDGNIKKATEMLQAALKWRKEYKPFAIKAEDVKRVMEQVTMTCGGVDKNERPVLVMKLATPNECSVDERVKQLVYILERTQKKHYDSIAWIVDFSAMGTGTRDERSKETRKATMHILQDYYPERLGIMLLYRTPWYVRTMITLVRPFLDKRTSAKIFIAGQTIDALEKYVALDQLPKNIGGTKSNDSLLSLEALPDHVPAKSAKPAAASS